MEPKLLSPEGRKETLDIMSVTENSTNGISIDGSLKGTTVEGFWKKALQDSLKPVIISVYAVYVRYLMIQNCN